MVLNRRTAAMADLRRFGPLQLIKEHAATSNRVTPCCFDSLIIRLQCSRRFEGVVPQRRSLVEAPVESWQARCGP